jgi:predicted O-methyltransferase YrrM
VLDDRVRAVLRRLEEQDAAERAAGLPPSQRSRAVAPTTGAFLYAVCAPQTDCEVLEIGGSYGYSTIWLAAAARILGGRVLSLELDPHRAEVWTANIEEAGLADWADVVVGDALETLPELDDVFDVVFLDAEKELYEPLFALARTKLETGALVIADNVLSHADTLGAYTSARRADPTCVSVTLPLDRGLELTSVLTDAVL